MSDNRRGRPYGHGSDSGRWQHGQPQPGRSPQGNSVRRAAPQYRSQPPSRGRHPERGRKHTIDYPRFGQRGWRRWTPSWGQIGYLAVGSATIGLAAFTVGYLYIDIPAANEQAQEQAVVYLWAGGQKEMYRGGTNRESVRLDTIPKTVSYAAVAAENNTFFEDSGVSPTAIGRAMFNMVMGRGTQGGSTITQQYAKNMHLGQERTLSRKAKEFFVALKIDQRESKDDILAGYLNTNYYGRGAYGVSRAARTYFGKELSRLNPAEGAVLAALMRSPGLYDPYLHRVGPGRWVFKDTVSQENERRLAAYAGEVLDRLAGLGRADFRFTQADADQWKTRLPRLGPRKALNESIGAEGDQRGYILQMIRDELGARFDIDEARLSRGGYRITTTIDAKAQQAATDAVREEFWSRSGRAWIPDDVHVALTAVEPGTGAIKAVYGDRDYNKSQYNGASTEGGAPVASTFKAFTLATALKNGIGLRSRFDGSGPYRIKDANGNPVEGEKPVNNQESADYGDIDLVEATKKSVNTAFVDLAMHKDVGPAQVKQVAMEAGIPDNPRVGLKPDARITLGVAAPSLVDLVNGYATIANLGRRAKPHLVEQVVEFDGDAVPPRPGQEIATQETSLSAEVCRDVIYALQQTAESGSARETHHRAHRTIAAKTGTGQDDKSALLVGFTKQLAAGVKIYRTNNQPLYGVGSPRGSQERLSGSRYPARIWSAFVHGALRGVRDESFPGPAWTGQTLNPAPLLPDPLASTDPSCDPLDPSSCLEDGETGGPGEGRDCDLLNCPENKPTRGPDQPEGPDGPGDPDDPGNPADGGEQPRTPVTRPHRPADLPRPPGGGGYPRNAAEEHG